MKDRLLSVEGLTVRTKQDVEILKNMSFQVNRGEIVSIVGLSGCGKSLTCKAILGLLDHRTFHVDGVIRFKEKDLQQISHKEMVQVRGKDICLIMQNPLTAFNPLTKIGVQLIETVRIHKKINKNDSVNLLKKALEEFNLGDLDLIFNSYPHTLSGGMLQRLMIGLALSLEPSMIIADEITSSIDAATKKSVLEEILHIKKKGIAILFVSHDIKEIKYISDRIVIMEKGQIIEMGTTEEIIAHQKESHTALLVKSSLIDGQELDVS